jgi:hypothetical protein
MWPTEIKRISESLQLLQQFPDVCGRQSVAYLGGAKVMAAPGGKVQGPQYGRKMNTLNKKERKKRRKKKEDLRRTNFSKLYIIDSNNIKFNKLLSFKIHHFRSGQPLWSLSPAASKLD